MEKDEVKKRKKMEKKDEIGGGVCKFSFDYLA
jgi:hypothetical protein